MRLSKSTQTLSKSSENEIKKRNQWPRCAIYASKSISCISNANRFNRESNAYTHTRTHIHTQRLYASHAQINTNQIQSNLMPSWNNQSPACLHHVHKTYGEWVTQQVKRLPLRAPRTNAMTTRRDASLQLLYIFKSDHERKQISRDFLSNSPPRVHGCNQQELQHTSGD